MSEEEVRAVLGPPDEIRRRISFDGNVWAYGRGALSGFPTRGQVWFDVKKRVVGIWGAYGKPPSERAINEVRLSHLLDIFGQIDPANVGLARSYSFDPSLYIKTANALLPFGKTDILTAANEYCRLTPPRQDNLFILLRILFDPPASTGYLARLTSNRVDPPDAPDKKQAPGFPILLVDDIPLLVLRDDPAEEGLHFGDEKLWFLDYLKKNCRLRSAPLHPGANPFSVRDKLAASYRWLWRWDSEEEGRQLVEHHLLRLVRSVIPEVSAYCRAPEQADRPIDSDRWEQFRNQFARLHSEWDPATKQYTAR